MALSDWTLGSASASIQSSGQRAGNGCLRYSNTNSNFGAAYIERGAFSSMIVDFWEKRTNTGGAQIIHTVSRGGSYPMTLPMYQDGTWRRYRAMWWYSAADDTRYQALFSWSGSAWTLVAGSLVSIGTGDWTDTKPFRSGGQNLALSYNYIWLDDIDAYGV